MTMLCGRCGKQSQSASHVCPYCGAYMGEEKPSRHISEDTPVYGEMAGKRSQEKKRRKRRPRRRSAPKPRKDSYYYKKHVINWAWVWFAVAILLFFLAIGSYVYLMVTPNGQVIMARMGREASADALWTVGEENMDRGDIPKAIALYEKAAEQEPENENYLINLFKLAEAYEAVGDTTKAEEIYTTIYTQGTGDEPSRRALRTQAYRSAIRLLNVAEAAELMRVAYEDTGDASFYKERSQLVPKAPTASLPGGAHMFTQTVSFLSDQGYEIFYTTSPEAILPEEGVLYTEPLVMTEGVHTYRAVCVSGDLMSDEMNVKYTIRLPVPVAPRANVQPGEHSRPFKVKLRNVGDDKDVRFYYTIDGTRPTVNSPEFTGDAIQLPSGRVNLRAIAVNKYGKVSNELVMDYKIGGSTKKVFGDGDKFDKFALMKTTKDQFITAYGTPTGEETGTDTLVKGTVTTLLYPWGQARFVLKDEGNLLFYVDTADTGMTAPRKTKVGMAMEEVTAQYRDMGQLPSPNGDRGIYYNTSGYGAYEVLSDNSLEGNLEYCYLETGILNPGTILLTYQIQGGRVARISISYNEALIPMIR